LNFQRFEILKAKLLHIGQKELWALGVANYIPAIDKWVFMYDVDRNSLQREETDRGIVPDDVPYEIYETKHGYQVIYYEPMELQEVYNLFKKWSKAIPGDYFWTVPLWMRVGEKFNDFGEIISPKPKLILVNKEYLVKKRKPFLSLKKFYRCWD